MQTGQPETPFTTLVAQQQSILSYVQRASYDEVKEQSWIGVAFLIGKQAVIAHLEEVLEIMKVSQLVSIPSVKPWLLGITTLRGEVFAVTDLNGFLTKNISVITSHSRILVLHYHEEYTGILVDKVLGLQRMNLNHRKNEFNNNLTELNPFLAGTFVNEHVELPIMSCKALIENSYFRNVAL